MAPSTGSIQIVTGSYRSRYAGAMLLHPYLDRVGAQAIFAGAGPPGRVGRAGTAAWSAAQAHRPPGRPGPGVGAGGVDPAGDR